jgi:hypothetical protein
MYTKKERQPGGGRLPLGCTVFEESSLVSRPVKPLCPLNRRCHRRGVRRARSHRCGRIPERRETVLCKSPVDEDVPRCCIAALGLIRDAAAHKYKSIDVRGCRACRSPARV